MNVTSQVNLCNKPSHSAMTVKTEAQISKSETATSGMAPHSPLDASAKEATELRDPTKCPREHIKNPCAPYFYYRDFSDLPDSDPANPVTPPGRIANFPAKMMAILSRPDLQHIISWMPHGRSWKVHKPREFEVKVIPMYFDHAKFSSFIRQANGWGFRRMIAKGPDRNSYYHELFLRGLPHLIKIMKRPTSGARPQSNAKTEPDFYRISDESPLPEPKVQFETEINVVESYSEQEHQKVHDAYSTTEHRSNSLPYSLNSIFASEVPLPEASNMEALQNSSIDAPCPPPESHDHFEPIPVTAQPVTSFDWNLSPDYEPELVHYNPEVKTDASNQVYYERPAVLEHHYQCAPAYPRPVSPTNQWTETCVEPQVMPLDFEDPFVNGLQPVDFW